MGTTTIHYDLLLKKIREQDADYNHEIKLLRVPFSSPGYHTTLKNIDYAHTTYPNMIYAVSLLDSGLPEYEKRALDVIRSILALQDTDPEHDTYGIWPWFYEEPLTQMSPPDWNWADFIGKLLLQAVTRHKSRLPQDLQEEIRQAVFHACNAIIKRDVGPWYTNIAIMGSFVTVIAGEVYARKDYLDYGIKRMERFQAFTGRLKTFMEYNSPAYAPITILELSKLRGETKQAWVKEICEDMLDLAWGMVSEHYHASTKQWAGPHSRSYRTLLKPDTEAFLQLATDGAAYYRPWEELYYSPEWYRSGIRCPDKYLHRFRESKAETIRRVTSRNEDTGHEKWATSYITPQYTLGTFSKEIFWNQTRGIVSYMDNKGQAVYVALRVLKNGYDYSSGLLVSQQHEGTALAGIEFFTHGGDTHPMLDKKSGVFEAEDFRVRFEIGGFLEGVACTLAEPDRVELSVNGLVSSFRLLYGEFQDETDDRPTQLRWELSRQDGLWCADCVIHSGPARTLDFHRIRKAALLFAVSIGSPLEPWDIKVASEENRVRATAHSNEAELETAVRVRPRDV
ncbi:hypothetical protein [Paenibacillus sp.]|uniref:hypothetical protein n=1 Tax=Paenibacillus sp. TaxID=58172 RepID=UPI002810C87B|nr:hypothetical protein [Paenibacillus sp.]